MDYAPLVNGWSPTLDDHDDPPPTIINIVA
jgi:hypothetical protein